MIETLVDPATLTLPAGVHAAVLGGRDVVTGGQLREVVLWHDRTTSTCPDCNQPIAAEVVDCPVSLNPGAGQGGALQDCNQQHGCGSWLGVDSRELGCDPRAEQIVAAAAELVAATKERIDEARATVRAELCDELAQVLEALPNVDPDNEYDLDNDARVDEAIDVANARHGSDMSPGVWRSDYGTGELEAWDFDPDPHAGPDEVITVRASEVQRKPNAAAPA